LTHLGVPLRLIRDNLAGLESPLRRFARAEGSFCGAFHACAKIGEGRLNRPRSRHCDRLRAVFRARTESQSTDPNQSKLTLSARESVASRLALFARLFYFGGQVLEFLKRCAIAATLGICSAAAPPFAFTAQNALTTPAPARATKAFTDDSGANVAVPVPVQRIVSLAPNLTETVYALGLEDKLAADTTYCDTPAAAKDKPHVGGPANPSLEAIVAAHPDVVLATTMTSRESVDALRKLGVAVYFTDPHTVRAMLDTTQRIAELTGAPEKGAELVASLQARLDSLHVMLAEQPLRHVLFVVWEDPLIISGQYTFVADALKWAGSESAILTTQDWPQVSMEEVLRIEPDYIVLTPNHAETDNSKEVATLQARPVWRELRAVKLGRIALADEEFIRPSPGLVGSIERLARQLHPEVFNTMPAAPATTAPTGGATKPTSSSLRDAAKECASCGR
jgi:iron complex transport system substrate-binding protein